jgi:methionyl-tRNA formyltransferase
VRIVFLAADDPIYLPDLFERVLAERAPDVAAVFAVPPLYKGQSTAQAAWRYFRTFGMGATLGLTRRIVAVRRQGVSIRAVCGRHGVVYGECADVNAAEFLQELRELRCDVIVSVSCPQIFQRDLIDLPELGLLNIHGAILPAYRGVMPSFWMLANGEQQAGVTIFFVNEDIDAGDVCGQREFEIDPDDTLDRFLVRSKSVAAELLLDVLRDLERGAVRREPIDLSAGSYYSWPTRDAVARFRARGKQLW